MLHTLSQAPSSARTISGCLAGVELGPQVIRVAVFSSTFEVLGKMKLSTKPERGFAAVAERVERCVRYGLDECDLPSEALVAVGIVVPGAVLEEGPVGWVSVDRDFGWKAAPLGPAVGARLGVPVTVLNSFVAGALAIHRAEGFGGGAETGMAVIFPGAATGLGTVVGGRSMDLSSWPPEAPMLAPGTGNIAGWTGDTRFLRFRPRDFRRAIRKREAPAVEVIRQSVALGVAAGAAHWKAQGIRTLCLAGGTVDENKAEMLVEAAQCWRNAVGEASVGMSGDAGADGVNVVASDLGDLCFPLGGVLAAADGTKSPQTA